MRQPKLNMEEYQRYTPLKDPITQLAENEKRKIHYSEIIAQKLNEKYPGYHFTPYIVLKTIKIFEELLYKAILRSRNKAPSTYSHAHQKLKYHIKLPGLFLLILNKNGCESK